MTLVLVNFLILDFNFRADSQVIVRISKDVSFLFFSSIQEQRIGFCKSDMNLKFQDCLYSSIVPAICLS